MSSGGSTAASGGQHPLQAPPADSAPLLGTPPSYKDVVGKIKAARDDAKDGGDFMQRFCGIICGTVGFVIMVGILLLVPILMIVVGSMNLNNCPAEKFIPIWLIVSGSVAAIMQLIFVLDSIADKCRKREPADEELHQAMFHRSHNWVLGCFWFAWFIAGNVWVFRIYAPNTVGKIEAGLYCDHFTYYLAFIILAMVYFIACTFLCCCSCIICCASISIRNRLGAVP